MKYSHVLVAAAAFALSIPAMSQGGAPAAGPAASATRPGPAGPGPGARWGQRYTSGWSLMNTQERADHQARMQSMRTYDECKSYMDQHHQQMVERAKDQKRSMPARPRRDACAALKKS